jgi:ADP-ribose pyrophosphatase YjhB (NUDIX family)
MHRNKNGKEYYTYPGGGLEENESLEDCVKREVKEEFGIEISPIRELYEYETEDSLQHFF